jgi:hypothetical protein
MSATTKSRSSLFDRSLPLKESSRNYLKFTHKKIMMKNKLKSIVLAIAVFAIVIVNNIGFGSFDSPVERLRQRVEARPKDPIMDRTTDIEMIPTPVFRKNYPAGIKYLRSGLFWPVWEGGAKQLLEQKMREAIDGKYLEGGDRFYDVNVKFAALDADTEVFSFDPSTNKGSLENRVFKDINFKTTNSSNPNLTKETFFAGEFSLRIKVNFSTTNQSIISDDRITVNSIEVGAADYRLYSNADSTRLIQVKNFWQRQNTNTASQIRGDSSIKRLWAGYIESTLDKHVPANILNRR